MLIRPKLKPGDLARVVEAVVGETVAETQEGYRNPAGSGASPPEPAHPELQEAPGRRQVISALVAL